ncbi:MAG: HNH endonuclease [Idiomarina sp.]
MVSKVIQKNRLYSAQKQNNRCFYCGLPMWHKANRIEFLQAYKLSGKQARWLQCTAEHKTARSDGGGNERHNIAAACRYCNEKRHQCLKPLNAEDYQKHVGARMARRKWFPESILLPMLQS